MMASLSNAKTLGGVGAILVLLAPAPSVGWILGIAGFILLLIAVKNISDLLEDSSIFNNMMVAIILGIVGVIVGSLVVVGSFYRFLGQNNLTPNSFGPNFNPSTIPTRDWVALILTALAGLAVIWILLTVSAVYVRRSYSTIASKLKVHTFATAGLFYLIGAATTIVLIGFLLIFIAEILVAVSFFSIDERSLEQGLLRSK
jgi:uncharacterized membrane protein